MNAKLFWIILPLMKRDHWPRIARWLPAIGMMAIIFAASNTPGKALPDFGPVDVIVKKAGHVLGYSLLALAYWNGLRFRKDRAWLAFLLAIVYAATDEVHQSFIPGRHPSWVDVLVFDGGGAGVALWLAGLWRARIASEAMNKE